MHLIRANYVHQYKVFLENFIFVYVTLVKIDTFCGGIIAEIRINFP